jgi:CarD family transcriptional regulator
MFKINDVVVYGSQGVCEIVDIEEKKIDGASKSYFVLKSKADRGATFYIPTWNEKAWGKMRKVMTQKDVDALIDAMPTKTPTWIANETERKEAYRKILASGNQAAIISMVQALFIHKKEREAEGKRLHLSDEHFMKDAEQLLYNEWQYVLNVDKAGLMDYIFRRIESNEQIPIVE